MTADVLDRRAWLRGGSALFGGAAVSVPLGAVAFVLIARELSIAELGLYSLVVAAVSLTVTLCTFRLETHLLLGLGDAAGDELATRLALAVRASLLITVPILTLIGIAVTFVPRNLPPAVFGWAAAEVLISPLLFARVILQMQGRQGRIAAATLIGRVSWVIWVGVLVVTGMSVTSLVVGRAVTVAIEAGLLIAWTGLRFRLGRPTPGASNERAALRASAPLALTGLAGMTYNRSDQFVITALVGAAENGRYAAPARLAEMVRVFSAVVQSVVTPALVRLAAEGRDAEFARASRDSVLAYVLPVGAAAAIGVPLAPLLVPLVLGEEYADAALVFQFLLVAEVAVSFGTAVGQAVWTLDGRRTMVHATVAGAVSNVLLTVPLVLWFGATGAGISSLIAYVVSGMLPLFTPALPELTRRAIGGPSLKLIACLCCALLALLLPAGPLVQALIAVAAYLSATLVCFRSDVRRVVRAALS